MGPGPELKEASVGGCDEEPVEGRRGEGRDGATGAPVVTALRFDGRILRAGSDGEEPAVGAGGGGMA